MKKSPSSANPGQLRSRAEARLGEQKKLKTVVAKTEADPQRLLHELQVHQIELEMQNAELRQARDELEVALENYTDLYDFAPVGYFTLTTTGAILQANLTGAMLLGIDRSRLVSQSFDRLITAEFRPAFSTFLKQVFTGKAKQSADFEITCQGQPLRFVNIEAQGILNEEKCRIAVVDITARKLVESALITSEARYRNLFNSMDEGYCVIEMIFDEHRQAVDYRFVEVNCAFEKQSGLNNVLGKRMMELVPAIEEKWLTNYGKVALTGEPIRFDNEYKGLNRWFDVYAFRIGGDDSCKVAVLFNNVTDRKNAEAKLRVSEDRYRTLFTSIDEGFCIIEMIFNKSQKPVDYRFLEVNPTFEKQTGLKDAAGKRICKLVPDIENHWIDIYGQVALTGESIRFMNEAKAMGGRWFDAYACRVGGTESRKIAVVFNDITERKKAELVQRRIEILAASNKKLEKEINHRKIVELELKTSGKQLQQLSRKILTTQEEERKRISRELHDTVLQTLVGINLHLASLTSKVLDNPTSLRRRVAQTQLLVEKSLAIVHRFAVELRPSVLDDLGLIPALHSYIKDFMLQTGLRAIFTVCAEVNELPTIESSVLYRVALEALHNVAMHAQASAVEVKIKKLPDWIFLTIKDDGKSFDVKNVLRTKENIRLGLLGMKERLEMISGKLSIKSSPSHGTTVIAQIPVVTKSVETVVSNQV